MLKKNDQVTIRIEDITKNGEGIGRADGFALFVKDTVPGDLAEVRVMKMKKSYGFARLIRVTEPSADRVKPPCPVARRCGGCQLQMMVYERQLQLKENLVRSALEHIGGFKVIKAKETAGEDQGQTAGNNRKQMPSDSALMYPAVSAQPHFRYRNKAVIPVGTDKKGDPVVGFYAGHTHAIIPCEDCLLGPEENGDILRAVLTWMKEQQIPAYRETDGTGLIRHIFLRKSRESGRIQMCLIINGETIPAVPALKEKLSSLRTPAGESLICGACFSVNTKRTNVIFGDSPKMLWGDPVLRDSLRSEKYDFSVQYAISPMSFYQVNPNIAEKMYEEVLALAELTGRETVFDLYCGTGTISLFLAPKAARVIGVEIVPEAVQNAKENARINGLSNAVFYVGKAEVTIPELLKKEDLTADVVVVDPPRKGCDVSLLQAILAMEPKKIIYVSCDPATLARDLKILCEEKYRIKSVRPYDQFAMGMHVETVCLLSNRKPDSYA